MTWFSCLSRSFDFESSKITCTSFIAQNFPLSLYKKMVKINHKMQMIEESRVQQLYIEIVLRVHFASYNEVPHVAFFS